MLGLVILITRDLFAHNALSLLAWVMAFFSLVNCGYRIDENSPAYLVLVIGILAFQFFFYSQLVPEKNMRPTDTRHYSLWTMRT